MGKRKLKEPGQPGQLTRIPYQNRTFSGAALCLIIHECIAPGKVERNAMHFEIEMWIQNHVPADQIDFTVDFYDITTGISAAILKKKDDTYLVVIRDPIKGIKEISHM